MTNRRSFPGWRARSDIVNMDNLPAHKLFHRGDNSRLEAVGATGRWPCRPTAGAAIPLGCAFAKVKLSSRTRRIICSTSGKPSPTRFGLECRSQGCAKTSPPSI